MMHTGPREGEVRAANEIFTLLPEGHDLAVIIDALAGRNGVSDKARSELSTRIRKLRIKGFRDANRAPHDRLVETILDAIAQGHGLMQAITRVNRVFRDKPSGLIVDYLGLAHELKRALATLHRERRYGSDGDRQGAGG